MTEERIKKWKKTIKILALILRFYLKRIIHCDNMLISEIKEKTIMEEVKDFFEGIMQNKVVETIIVIILSFLIYRFFHRIISKGEKNTRLNKSMTNRGKTYFKLIINIIRYVFIIITLLIVLQINGVNVSSLLAGVGILSVIIGLAVQDALKDIIRGFSILSDDYFTVGDIIKYGEAEGRVLSLGFKTTKIQDIKTGYIISIANRNIEQVEVVSNLIYINIPMPYEVTVENAEKAIEDIVEIVKVNNNVDGCRYVGVNELADSSINYLIEVKCKPDFKLQVRRDTLRSILQGLAKNNISVPYNQIDVHNK